MDEPIHSTETRAKQQGLYLVSTPIGNLRDITQRALDTLQMADAVLCEDTRVTGQLLKAYGLRKKMIVYNDHADDDDRTAIMDRLREGQMLALVSDAGTPLVSDPGFKLVQMAVVQGVPVIPVPGASALLPALQLSALPADRFLFAGFLPHKSSARRTIFEEFKNVRATLVFYESANRLADAIADAFHVMGDRPVATAREITKLFEGVQRGTLAEWAADESKLGTLKGEFVLMIAAAPKADSAVPDDVLREKLAIALATMSLKDAVAAIADQSGVSKKHIYELALALKK